MSARPEPVRTVLVVGHDPHSRQGLRDVLLQDGWAVETAADTWQAIVTLREHEIAVAIVDLDLPLLHGIRLSGGDIARIFRAYRPTIALILVSAEDDVTPGVPGRALDRTEVLEKPISPAHVTATVRALAAGARGGLGGAEPALPESRAQAAWS